MSIQSTLPERSVQVSDSAQEPRPQDFQNSVSAIVKGIACPGADALTIATADNHRGSGFLDRKLDVLSSLQPISGTLYYNSWDEVECGKIKYNVSLSGQKLIITFMARSKFTTSSTTVAYIECTLPGKGFDQGFEDGPYDFEFWYFPDNVQEVAFSIFSGEVITAGTDINVYPNTAVHHDPDAFHIVRDGHHFPTKVTWKKASVSGGTSVGVVSTNGLAAGRYNLVVGELKKQTKNEHANEFYYVVEFIIGDTVGFGELQVVHMAQMQLGVGVGVDGTGEAPVVQRIKAIDRATGEPTSFATNEGGQRLDAEMLLADEASARFEQFGFAHEHLHHHIQDLPDDAKVHVVVWAHVQPDPARTPDDGEGAVDLPADVLAARDTIKEAIERCGGQVTLQPANEPYLYATVPKKETMGLAGLEQVGGLFHDNRTIELDLANSIKAAKSDAVVTAGYKGKGIHVAVHESGPKTLTNLALADRYTESPVGDEKHDRHARLTHAIVKNVEPNGPHGHAPSCLLYSANSSDNAALEWALDSTRACTVLSKSFHRTGEDSSGSLSHDDILFDWKATRWPCPTFTLAAGNFVPGDGKLYVNHKGYNTVKVGSHHDDGLAMAASSEYRNPPSAHGDRELPEIAANGTVVGANEQLSSGTSFAAPAVAGIVALVQQINPRLQRFPEACRAILFASAGRSGVGGSWWGGVAARDDGRAGAGAVDAQMAMAIAQAVQGPCSRPSARGWAMGWLEPASSSTLNASLDSKDVAYARYYVAVPYASASTAASTSYAVKAALTWNSEVSSNKQGQLTDSRLTADLDLYVRDAAGRLVALSASFDNNYEIAEFYVRPGDVFELSIVKVSGVPNTRYGIAWAVHQVPWAVKRP
ncbi:subtilisin-like protein [Amniculicola lignicola CBS 123094]|uniref:Subtilisin-like protein n=1 Tax=Amniculicola lignicola CBS 123094 TaxID=1392246 RepID=A0A6A5W261_9PLEO|nr:subtilisin-like protein [Amniculicola lignicola CBS 123094]